MDDPYRIRPNRGEPDTTGGALPRGEHPDRVVGMLWAMLAVFVGLNAVVSITEPDNVLLSLMFGVPGVVCLVLLVMRYMGRRRS
ncbi:MULTISPECIES: hypothetical protein [unclassified Rhodococcus (in: high G+C Gram-positive bacteria)]|uniref:hypothetical protein n=1 Tax=Rhodococcus sp. SJ-3 TaxID=3454628 RepID=UPI002D95C194|nr:hypothetical protein [Rhodococcus sp. (in: high G+C Gram-positive bacteria)]